LSTGILTRTKVPLRILVVFITNTVYQLFIKRQSVNIFYYLFDCDFLLTIDGKIE
jgi:uncharacterized membrane protein